jgi:hypothetical protein
MVKQLKTKKYSFMKQQIYTITLLFITLLGFSHRTAAQESSLMHFMRQSPQSLRTNPANLYDSVQWYMGIPFLFSHVSIDAHLGFAYNDIIQRQPDHSLQINPKVADKLISSRFMFATNYELISFGFHVHPQHMITFSTSLAADASVLLPGELATLLVKGNTPGETLHIKSDVNVMGYLETALGYSYSINKDWKAGIRLKYLIGMGNAYGRDLAASIHTDPNNYAMTLKTNALLQVSYVEPTKSVFENTGMAFDAGVYYHTPVEGLSVGASMVDWGWIDWRSSPRVYETKITGGEFVFSGLTSLDDDFGQILDTLGNIFEFQEGNGKSYRTPLPGKIYLSATYDLTKDDKFGFLFSTRALDHFSRTTVTLMYNRSVGRWLSVAVGNNFMTSKFFNPSMALNLRGGAFQFYIAAENFSSFNLTGLNTMHFQFGFNLTFLSKALPANTKYFE